MCRTSSPQRSSCAQSVGRHRAGLSGTQVRVRDCAGVPPTAAANPGALVPPSAESQPSTPSCLTCSPPDGQCCVHQLIGQSTRRQARQIGPVFGHIEPATLIEAERRLTAFLGIVKKRCLVFVGSLLSKGGRSTGKRLTPPITARLAPQRPDRCSPAKRARLAPTANT